MFVVRSLFTVFLAGSVALAAAIGRMQHVEAGAPHAPPACESAEYHQFDFFEGDWDAYDFGVPDSIIAHNVVTPMLGGCAVREVYVQRDGMRGESFSTFDASRQLWHQSWVTNHGAMLLLDGRLHEGRMVLTARETDKKGGSSLLRGIWIPGHGSVRETAQRSKDGGKTWEPVFDIVFRPHKPANSA
ncbi:MAG: hypothetical protein M3Y30_08475 [Gemmatimonadota bacterium]|nr:hypothetical protein [Gemmatimonadota bacterium]